MSNLGCLPRPRFFYKGIVCQEWIQSLKSLVGQLLLAHFAGVKEESKQPCRGAGQGPGHSQGCTQRGEKTHPDEGSLFPAPPRPCRRQGSHLARWGRSEDAFRRPPAPWGGSGHMSSAQGAALLKETRVGASGRGGARGAPLILQKEDGEFTALGVFWWAPRLCSHPEAFPAAGPRVAGGGSVEVTAESESRQTMYASQRSSSSADPGVGWPAGTVQGALFSCLWQLDGLEIPKPLSSSAGRNH